MPQKSVSAGQRFLSVCTQSHEQRFCCGRESDRRYWHRSLADTRHRLAGSIDTYCFDFVLLSFFATTASLRSGMYFNTTILPRNLFFSWLDLAVLA